MAKSRPKPPQPRRAAPASGRRWDVAIYTVAALFVGLIGVGLVGVVVGGDSGGEPEHAGAIGECDNAGVEPSSGTAAGLVCDDRTNGTVPAIEQGDPELAARRGQCTLKTELPEEGTEHVPPTAQPRYRTIPATSGPMYEQTIADGAFLTTPPEPSVVHSLEHGRVSVQYDPDLSEAAQSTLKALFDEDPLRVLLFPNPRLRGDVAATAWTDLLRCPRYSEEVIDALRTFRDLHRGHAPEG